MATEAVRRDVADPATQVGQRPLRELEQRRVGGALPGELGVVDALANPRALAKVLQPDHARAALQRVEGAPDGGQQRHVTGAGIEADARLLGSRQHLVRFFQEDVAQFVALVERDAVARDRGRSNRGAAQRGDIGLQAHGVGTGRDELDQRIGQLAAHGVEIGLGAGLTESLLRLANRGCQRALIGRHGFVGQALHAARDLGHWRVVLARRHRELLHLLKQARLHRRGGVGRAGGPQTFGAPHHRAERAGFGVVDKQRLGHLRLHAEHVDQEPQGAEVASNAVKDARLRDALGVHHGRGQAVDIVAHAQQRR